MCDSCGCGDSELVPVAVHGTHSSNNDRVARHNREHFHDHGVSVINLMGSPGSGKTAVLKATAHALGASTSLGVLVGDLPDNDARRVRAAGIVAEAITTGSACHLDADMVAQGLHRGALAAIRHSVHRERRQPGLPGRLRPRTGRQCRHLSVTGRRGQTAQMPRRCSGRLTSCC